MRYAISDIHGCLQTFRSLLEDTIVFNKNDTLFLLGDYIDRGPDVKGLLDYIMALRSDGYQIIALKGNHEDVFMQVLKRKASVADWIYNGGRFTLDSFGCTMYENVHAGIAKIPAEYISFLEHLQLYVVLDDYWLVHAGFNFTIDDPLSDEEAMLWLRRFDVDKNKLGKRKIIHGHTPTPVEMIIENCRRDSVIVNIDAGCVYAGKPGLGNLAAYNMDTCEVRYVKNCDV